MRVRYCRPLPACFSRHPAARGIVLERDIRMTSSGRLRAKLIVFESVAAMRRFWKAALGLSKGDLGPRVTGAVNSLSRKVQRWSDSGELKREWLEVDPRYFCVIGLVKRHLTTEIVCHEAMHVGFAYAKRRAGDPWKTRHEFDEEEVAYPAGMAALAIITALHDAGFWG